MPDLRERCEQLAERLEFHLPVVLTGAARFADGTLRFSFGPTDNPNWQTVPAPAAPLHEHLAFVGRIATALPEGWRLVQVEDEDAGYGIEPAWVVRFWGRKDGTKVGRAPSPTEAAIDAALAVLEETP